MVRFELPYLSNIDFQNLEKFILNPRDPRKSSTAVSLYSTSDIYDNSTLKPFCIGVFNSTKKHPYFLFENNLNNTFVQEIDKTFVSSFSQQSDSITSNKTVELETLSTKSESSSFFTPSVTLSLAEQSETSLQKSISKQEASLQKPISQAEVSLKESLTIQKAVGKVFKLIAISPAAAVALKKLETLSASENPLINQ